MSVDSLAEGILIYSSAIRMLYINCIQTAKMFCWLCTLLLEASVVVLYTLRNFSAAASCQIYI